MLSDMLLKKAFCYEDTFQGRSTDKDDIQERKEMKLIKTYFTEE